jgi:hypothetical protein
MRFAVDVENRACGIPAEAAGACLVSHAGNWDFRLEVSIARKQMVWMHAQMLEHGFQLIVKLLLGRLII